ncbi:hypothetical protein BKA14_000568 [Actinoplanes abujensis]|uniref:Uncharacterized protein n=1 Tax=Paractinoplanes abujensis TaxID=882441 RepID=A0A7W7CKW5_9ACTN|nr:hypothetical protein [Actinoplanes abujensis]
MGCAKSGGDLASRPSGCAVLSPGRGYPAARCLSEKVDFPGGGSAYGFAFGSRSLHFNGIVWLLSENGCGETRCRFQHSAGATHHAGVKVERMGGPVRPVQCLGFGFPRCDNRCHDRANITSLPDSPITHFPELPRQRDSHRRTCPGITPPSAPPTALGPRTGRRLGSQCRPRPEAALTERQTRRRPRLGRRRDSHRHVRPNIRPPGATPPTPLGRKPGRQRFVTAALVPASRHRASRPRRSSQAGRSAR